jgi:DNA-binding CsgD family transcriptional regulator
MPVELITRNNEIRALRSEGNTLQAIGIIHGITRERVRQLCTGIKPKRRGFSRPELAKLLGVSRVWVDRRLRGRSPDGALGLTSERAFELRNELHKICKQCGEPFESKYKKRVFCTCKCTNRWIYEHRTAEQRARYLAKELEWQKNNPEKMREYQRRFYDKHRKGGR